jgi:hypothetical protein
MGDSYTRQETYTDGDVITAAHTNNEFDQILAAFAASTGHTHDGTEGEGGPISALAVNTVTIGAGTVNSDVIVTFDGEERDGILRWIGHDNSGAEDDHFRFDDDVMVNLAEKLYFRDTAIYINSSTDGQLDLIADGTVLIDTAGDITLDADGGDIFFKDAGTTFGSVTNSSGNLIIKSGTTTAITFSGANTTFAGTVTIGSAEISETELEILDGATVTTDELNYSDTGASVGTVVASKVVTVDSNKDVASFRNITLTGELDAGSLDVSGNADIDGTLEADAITVDGTALATVIAGTTVTTATNATHVTVTDNENTNEENLITFIEDASATGNVGLESDGDFTYNPSTGTVSATIFKGNIDAVDGDFDGTLEADAITVGGTSLADVIAGTTVTNATNATNAVHVSVADNENTNEENLIPFIEDASATGNVGLESDGDFAYNPSTGTVTATIFKGNIDAVDGDFDGTLEADAITVGGTALNTVIAGVTVTNATNAAHVTVTDNESTNEENLITFVEDATSSSGNVGLEMDGHLTYNPSTGTVSATIFKGNIDAVDGDFDGTLEADAITLNGTAITTTATLSTGISNGNVLVANANVADNDFLRVDGTSIEGRTASQVLSDIGASAVAGSSSIVTTGALDSGSITSGFGSIDNGSSTANFGATTVDSLDVSEGNITNVGSIALDSISSDAGNGTAIVFNQGNVPNTNLDTSVSGDTGPDFSQYTNFIWTLTGDLVLTDPGDEVQGQSGIFVFIQDGSGSRTLSHANDVYRTAGGTAITLSTAGGAIDIVPYFVQADGTIHLGAAQLAFADA